MEVAVVSTSASTEIIRPIYVDHTEATMIVVEITLSAETVPSTTGTDIEITF